MIITKFVLLGALSLYVAHQLSVRYTHTQPATANKPHARVRSMSTARAKSKMKSAKIQQWGTA